MSTEIPFDPTHPANTEILRCCKSGGYENTPRDFSPKAEWLDELGSHLPDDCRGNAYGSAVLVRPSTGIIFALAGNTIALRLPEKTREVALANNDVVLESHRYYTSTARKFGYDWVLLENMDKALEVLHLSYNYAGDLTELDAEMARAEKNKPAPVPPPTVCPACQEPLRPGASFCFQCGNRLINGVSALSSLTETSVQSTGYRCFACRALLQLRDPFCGTCGRRTLSSQWHKH